MISEQRNKLYMLIDEYWEDYVNHKNANDILIPSLPVIWFGNIEEYFESETKVVTVSINPSDNEFSDGIDKNTKEKRSTFKRFERAECLKDIIKLNNDEKDILIKTYNEYFINFPYKWFSKGYENLMKIFPQNIPVSYGYRREKNIAIHIDCQSAMAVKGRWKDKDRTSLIREDLFNELLAFLNPDIIVFSAKSIDDELVKRMVNNTAPDQEYKLRTTSGTELIRASFIVDKDKKRQMILFGTNFRGDPFMGIAFDKQKETILKLFKNW